MCTLTWNRPDPETLEVWFNRDENKARLVADPPELYELDGVRFLSPRDPQGGGTWMLANEYGLVICLLNRWELGVKEGMGIPKSRGQLVWNMARAQSLDQMAGLLAELENYPPFILAGLSSDGEKAWDWDGKNLRSTPLTQPLTSSSYCFREVKKAREAAFLTTTSSEDYHASAGEKWSAFTVRMMRPDAQTWSRSVVRVSDEIQWDYLAEQADLAGEPEAFQVRLALLK
jgi:hypothetical protein